MKRIAIQTQLIALLVILFIFSLNACKKDDEKKDNNNTTVNGTESVFLLIDEESIDNGNEPNQFSATDVNDNIAEIGLRSVLPWFRDNVGKTITLFTGQVGEEGWFAPRTIPQSWKSAGPGSNGTRNFFVPGPGLGARLPDDKREEHLDNIPDLTPLRATALAMLKGKTVYAVVYDSDVNVNYSLLSGSAKGAQLGVVAFDVLDVQKRTDGSSSDLPKVTIRVRSVSEVSALNLSLFSNAPVPSSSGEPFDINPPASFPPASLTPAP